MTAEVYTAQIDLWIDNEHRRPPLSHNTTPQLSKLSKPRARPEPSAIDHVIVIVQNFDLLVIMDDCNEEIRPMLRVNRRQCPHYGLHLSLKTYKAHRRLFYNSEVQLMARFVRDSHQISIPLPEEFQEQFRPLIQQSRRIVGTVSDCLKSSSEEI